MSTTLFRNLRSSRSIVPRHSMGEPRTPAITWLDPARRWEGISWVSPVGSLTQAVSVSPSQYSKRPS